MEFTRRRFLKNVCLLPAIPLTAASAAGNMHAPPGLSTNDDGYTHLIYPPVDPGQWDAFREELLAWRKAKRSEMNYTGSSYDDPAFHWATRNFSCCFLMIYDLAFYDPVHGKYTVGKVLERGRQEFGGYDSIVLWHAYPRIGIDERNQFDFYRDMPGGLEAVKDVVRQFRERNVRVFINYNPWDVSTRREGKRDVDALVKVVAAINADGIFLDTMKEADKELRSKLNAIRPGIVLEGEFAADLENLPSNHSSWAQWFGDKYVPGILRNKWFERRHIQHQIARWDRDHTTELHQAWMNGSGMMVWENVFGQWIAWNERDKSILRAMLPVQRRYSKLFLGEGWTPLVLTAAGGVFANLWEADGIRLWTLVNRHDKEISGELVRVPHKDGDEYYDLVKGKQAKTLMQSGERFISGTIAARSIACFVAGNEDALGRDFPKFLSSMRKINESYNGTTALPVIAPVLKKVKPTLPASASALEGMVEINPATFNQTVEFVIREVGTYSSYMEISVSPQLQDPYVMLRMVHISHIAIDITPVTNSQYFQFVQSSGYKPKENHFFLKHWTNGKPPAGKENHPVVYVDLEDARAYAQWLGKRLPTEPEWQFAAEGYDALKYPWGKELQPGRYNATNDTTPVDRFPSGKSSFGCYDMCGNTWELTESEYSDNYNRFCILKGGSYYHAKGSMWYTSGGPQPSALATKFLMIYPGLDRCSTIGFRCVKDM